MISALTTKLTSKSLKSYTQTYVLLNPKQVKMPVTRYRNRWTVWAVLRKISAQGSSDQGDGRRLGREGETRARDRDSEDESQDRNYIASESAPGFKPTDRAVEKDLFQEMKALGLNKQSLYEHYARATPKMNLQTRL